MKPVRLIKFTLNLAKGAAALALASGSAWAQNAIQALNVTQQAGAVVLQVTMKDVPTAAPAGFTIANPPRIALDFAGTTNALGKNSQDVGQGELRSVNVVQVGDRSRMVLNLRNATGFETRLDGKNVLITLSGGVASTAAASSGPSVAASVAPGSTALKDIDFRRGKQGEGRILVELGSSGTGVDIRQQGQSLVVDFLKSSLPENLRKRLDVGDFATPVQTINAFSQGDNVRLVIEPKGLWEHNAYQTDTQFVVEVKPVKEDPNKLVQGTRQGYQGERLSLNFQNIEVRSVLQVIADFTNLNIITSDSVAGALTLRLKDVPWDQALDIILQTRGLDMRKNGNVIWIAPREEISTKEKLELEARSQIVDLEPVRTEAFQLNYQTAANVRTLLTDSTQKILSKRGSAVVDARTNQIFVQDTPGRLDDVRRLLAKIDVPVQQVLIEARIVEAVDNFSKNLGARLGFNDRTVVNSQAAGNNAPRRALISGDSIGGTGVRLGQTPDPGTGYFPDSFLSNMRAGGLGGINPGQVALSLFSRNLAQIINIELSALEADGKGKIISSPRVITTNNVEATIEQGTELPYQQATSSGATSVSFRKANLSLKATPQITPDGNVILQLSVNKDSVGQVTTAGFAIDTKAVKTQVLVENGGTIVIGGIYTQNERDTLTKVPFFGDVPVFGNLFKNSAKTNDKTELLIFITPRIVSERLSIR